jgi:Na+-driven multidrug efflux pump
MKTAALIMGAGLAVNALANYILMGPLKMGVTGAAWGTNIAMFVYCLLGWIYFKGGYASFKTKVFVLYADKETLGSIVKLGIPMLIMQAMLVLQGALVFNTLAKLGTTSDIAFYGVAYRLFTFLTNLPSGLMKAFQPVCGINYGAKQYARVIRACKIFTVSGSLLTIPFWLIIMAIPNAVLGLMLPGQVFSPTDIAYSRIYMAILPLLSLFYMALTFFPAIGKGAPASILGIVRQFVLYIPMILLLPRIFGIGGIYYGSLAVNIIVAGVSLILLQREFKLMRRQEVGQETINHPTSGRKRRREI